MGKLIRWNLKKITEMIVLTLLNKYDFVCMIDGARGMGKSTLGIVIARRVSREFTKLKRFDEETIDKYFSRLSKIHKITFEEFIEKIWNYKENKSYNFKIKQNVVYTRDKVINEFNKWHRIILADEQINVSFNRDFYNETQKDLIKIMNMNRDHMSLYLGAVPTFTNLDTQIKGLTKLRLTVLRRGIALIQTPNKSIYSKDRWDTITNEKHERDWIKKNASNPKYGKLTTVRGILTFPDLPPSLRRIYEEVKRDERNIIAKEEFGINENGEQEEDPVKRLAIQIAENGIKNGAVLDGFAMGMNLKDTTLKARIIKELKQMGKNPRLSSYYWDKKKNKGKADKTSDKTYDDVDDDEEGQPELSLMQRIRTK